MFGSLTLPLLLKAAPVLIPVAAKLAKHLFDTDNKLLNDLIELAIEKGEDKAKDKLEAALKQKLDVVLAWHQHVFIDYTGWVLGQLVQHLSQQQQFSSEKKELEQLAEQAPEGWKTFVLKGSPGLSPVHQDVFLRQMAAALSRGEELPPIDTVPFITFFNWHVRLSPSLQERLATHLRTHLDNAVQLFLVSDYSQANQAYKQIILNGLEGLHASLNSLHQKTDVLHYKMDATVPVVVDTNQRVQQIQIEQSQLLGPLVELMKGKTKEERLIQYNRALLAAFRPYQELAIDHFAAADQAAPDIWDIFVHPACAEEHLRPEEMDAAQQETPPRNPAVELLPLLAQDEHRRTVLLGDPGMGKSTLIQALIAHLASGRALAGAPALTGLLPVPLILRDLVPLLPQDQVESWSWDALLDAFLCHYQRDEAAPLLCDAFKDHLAEFRQHLHSDPKVFFLIDGLDEIGDVTKRVMIVQCLQDGMFQCHEQARWLCTSRIIGYDAARLDQTVYSAGKRSEDEMSKLTLRFHKFRVPARKGLEVLDATDLSSFAIWKMEQNLPIRASDAWRAALDSCMSGCDLAEEVETLISSLPPDLQHKQTLELIRHCRVESEANRNNLGPAPPEDPPLGPFIYPIAQRLYLAPFDDRRQDAFTQRWFQHRHGTDHSKELMREVRAHHHDGVRIISRVANLLCLMNILKRSGKPLPDGRAALYDEIVKAYLGGIDAAYRLRPVLGNTCPFDAAQRRFLLALLGAHMQQQRIKGSGEQRAEGKRDKPGEQDNSEGTILISKGEIAALLVPVIERLVAEGRVQSDHTAQELLDELLHHIASRSGLLIPRSSDEHGETLFGFTHLSFMEFFAAEWLGMEFDRQRNRIVRQFLAREEGQELHEDDLDREFPPRGPVQHSRESFQDLPALPAWHEPLIFLLETRKADAPTLLRGLFPALHTANREQRTENREHKKPLLPLDAVRLLVKLTADPEIPIPSEKRQAWWRILWAAYLSWPHLAWESRDGKNWPIASLLLERSENRKEVIDALMAELPAYSGKLLVLYECSTLTSEDMRCFAGVDSLLHLSLAHCTGLKDTAWLASLRQLEILDLGHCSGLKGSHAFQGLAGMKELKTLNLFNCPGLIDTAPLANMRELEMLDLGLCTGLHGTDALRGLENLSALRELHMSNCTSIESLPNLRALHALRLLDLTGCRKLKNLEEVRRQLSPDCVVIGPHGRRL